MGDAIRTPDEPAQVEAGGTAPTASIIVVNYNGRPYLQACLSALLSEHNPDHEVILVDNASTDGSPEYVEQTFPEVRIVRNQNNAGFGQGFNLGAQHARGRVLACLNPDTAVEPGWLDHLVIALQANPRVGLVTSKILLMSDPQRINTCGNDVHCTGLTLCRGMGRDSNAFTEPTEVDAVSGAAFAVRRETFEALGGFDADFFMYMEDTDLSWRARLAGYTCLCAPESVVYHDYSLHFGPRKTFYQERNRYLMLLKSLRWGTFAALLPALLLGEGVTWGFVLLRERRNLGNKLQAYAWVFRHWRSIMKARRTTQSLRRIRDRDLIARCSHRLSFEQTGPGVLARAAHVVFDPLFFLLHRLALALVWW